MRILMVGNSLTTANGLPDLLAARLDAQVDVHARGGARLSEHLNPATKLGARTQAALAAGGIDYLVMQEMSNGPVRFRERFLDSTRRLAEAARAAGATPILYATWAYAPGCPKLGALGMSQDEMHAAMHGAALEAAEGAQAVLADACLTFHAHPDAPALYAPDGVHPSAAGTQVALDAIAGAIEGAANPEPAAYTVYLLRCRDGSFYTGITTDVGRRFQEHLSRGPKAANYTRMHPVESLAATWPAADRAQASRMEYRIKRLTHAQKLALEADPHLLGTLLCP